MDDEWLVTHFEQRRPRLRAVAYRMLGSLAEADDAVQDTWLRLSRSGTEGVEHLDGWLTTIVARVCLNMLRSRDRRHEEPLDAHVPDPVIRQAVNGFRALFGHPAAKLYPVLVNGSARVLVTMDGRPFTVMGFTVTGGKIAGIDAIADPFRVSRLAADVLTA